MDWVCSPGVNALAGITGGSVGTAAGTASVDARGSASAGGSNADTESALATVSVAVPRNAAPGGQSACSTHIASDPGSDVSGSFQSRQVGGGGGAIGALASALGCSGANCFCTLSGLPCEAPFAAAPVLALAGGDDLAAALASTGAHGAAAGVGLQGAVDMPSPALPGDAPGSVAPPVVQLNVGALQLADGLLL